MIELYRSKFDSCVYINIDGNKQVELYLLLYVDEILIIGIDINSINALNGKLMNEFEMNDIEDIKKIISIEIRRKIKEKIIILPYQQYLQNLSIKYGVADSKSIIT